MADAICGPSNALQSFQKHSQVDRTLQQDRLTGPRHSSAQGFRSFDPRIGSLDADFHAFENSVPHPLQFEDPFLNGHHHAPPPFQQRLPPQTSSWATDFANLHVSNQPIPAQQFRIEAPLLRSAQGGWQNEFMKHREGQTMSNSQGKQAMLDQVPLYGSNNQLQYQSPAHINPLAPPRNIMQHDGQLDWNQQEYNANSTAAADWSQAFEAAFESAMETEQSGQISDLNEQQNIQIERSDEAQEVTTSEPLAERQEAIRIGSDAIDYTEVKDRSEDSAANDANALARVAGELLHNVQGESSEKFQNSQFLDLMRKIRDRQVEVINNDFEATQIDTSRTTNIDATAWNAHAGPEAEHARQNNQDSFQFPDLNHIYQPNPADAIDYSFDSDQYPVQLDIPINQIQELHPGGRHYPASPDQHRAQMSGGVGSLPAEEFEKIDESRAFAMRYQRPIVEAESSGSA